MTTYPLFKVHVDCQEALAEIENVFKSGYINEGVQVTELTTALQNLLNAPNLMLLNSCTSALTLALHLSDVRTFEDAVVTTPMTCVATNTPIKQTGAWISWADVDPWTGMVTPETVEDALRAPGTKAVMVVCWAGNVPNLSGIAEVCKRHHAKFILDAAHAFGAVYHGRPIHEFADFTCYSFQAIKHFTTGDGGALVVNDHDTFARAKALKWFGLDRDRAKDERGDWKGQQWDVDIIEAGFKFNMNNVAAAIGLSQLNHIDYNLSRHRQNAVLYEEAFKGHGAAVPLDQTNDTRSSHWVYAMRLDPKKSKLTRDELLKALNAEGIMAGVVHVPNDDYTCFKQYRKHLPGVREFSEHQFALPCGWWIDNDAVVHIAKRVKELVG